MSSEPDVVVVGAGPAGSSAAYHLAARGLEVVLVERRRFPRDKTCGDGLTPRAVRWLLEMGYDFSQAHRVEGIRITDGANTVEVSWPSHPQFPTWGAVVRRADLDSQLARLAEKQGAVLREGLQAQPLLEESTAPAVELHHEGSSEVARPQIIVVADGAPSRFGRALGTRRDRGRPLGLAARGYFQSPRALDPFLECRLDLRDETGATVPGYGWVFPLGDDSVNVGAMYLTSRGRWRGSNTYALFDRYVDETASAWELSSVPASSLKGGYLPAGFSIGPAVGPNWLLVGDAAGAINPSTGEGISVALETGKLAAELAGEAIESADLSRLAAYPYRLTGQYGAYFRLARQFTRLIANPRTARALSRTLTRSETRARAAIRALANLVDFDKRSSQLATYRLLELAAGAVPER